MQNNFDLKKFLAENKLTPSTQMSEITVKGKKVKTSKQNGDKSYDVEFEDGSKDTIAVSHDDWDALNKKESLNEVNIFDTNPKAKKALEKLMAKGMSEKDAKKAIVDKMNASDREGERDEKRAFNLNEDLLNGLADYKVAFDIATDIGISAALVGFGIYKLGIKKTIELLKKGAAEFKEMVKWAMGKDNQKK